MTEFVKYGTVQFASDATMAGFVQHGKKGATLMFNRVSSSGGIPAPRGDGPNARSCASPIGGGRARADELRRAAVAWCEALKTISQPVPRQ